MQRAVRHSVYSTRRTNDYAQRRKLPANSLKYRLMLLLVTQLVGIHDSENVSRPNLNHRPHLVVVTVAWWASMGCVAFFLEQKITILSWIVCWIVR